MKKEYYKNRDYYKDLEISEDRLNIFKQKLELFKDLRSISEAKNLAKQIFHINNELSYINFDNAKCVIVYSATLFRITFESDSEFACYSIVKQN